MFVSMTREKYLPKVMPLHSLLPGVQVSLPPFQSLLVTGNYPSTSPFYLCLSHLASLPKEDHPQTILVTAKSRSSILNHFSELNDRWLAENVGLGKIASTLSRIRIYYPHTPNHWIFFFSLLHSDYDQSDVAEESDRIFRLDHPPSLVVLHEPSAYFLDNDSTSRNSYTIHSYLRLIMSALAAIRSLGIKITLVVYDSRAQELALPILPIYLSDPIVDVRSTNGEDEDQSTAANPVFSAIVRYFDLVGHAELDTSIETESNEEAYKISFFCPQETTQGSHVSTSCIAKWIKRRVLYNGPGSSGTEFQCIKETGPGGLSS